MGLIKAAIGSVGSVLADQWREYFYCDSLPANVLVTKGSKRTANRSSNTKGSDNIITNGSIIAVNEGQCAMIVEQGKIVEFTAEPGEFTWEASTEGTIFYGNLDYSLQDTWENMKRRFTYGGDSGKDQRVYFFNLKEIVGNKKKLTQWQDDFWSHMVKKYPELERGESASLTGRTHIPPRVYKEAVRLGKQQAMLMDLIHDITPLNAKRKAAELEALLGKYIPGVEKMRTQLKKYDAAYKQLKAESDSGKLTVAQQMEIAQKLSEYEDLRRVVENIPEEILTEYGKKQEQKKTQEVAYE